MIICFLHDCCIGCSDWITFGLGVFVSIVWGFIIYLLRPKIRIGNPQITEVNNIQIISIPIENLRRYSRATRIMIEVCVIHDGLTYHLISDSNDFAFIPKMDKEADNIRKFKVYKLNDYLSQVYPELSFEIVSQYLLNPDCKLRVRIHSTHSFSGLGKTEEEYFYQDKHKNEFVAISKKC